MLNAWPQADGYPASACQLVTAHWLRAFPPGDTVASYLGVSFSAYVSASAPPTVLPVRSGQQIRGSRPSVADGTRALPEAPRRLALVAPGPGSWACRGAAGMGGSGFPGGKGAR
jgi:hypothetical protein